MCLHFYSIQKSDTKNNFSFDYFQSISTPDLRSLQQSSIDEDDLHNNNNSNNNVDDDTTT